MKTIKITMLLMLMWTMGVAQTDQKQPEEQGVPIELLSFNANTEGRYVRLDWATASETNNNYFTIERSDNGYDWEKLEEIQGAGYSSAIVQYETLDQDPLPGISLYRLKQTDFDGKYGYFDTELVSLTLESEGDSGVVFPNPSPGFVTVRIEGKIKGKITISVYDMLGAVVHREKDSFSGKGYEKQVDLNDLPNGYYILTVKGKGVSFVENIEIITE